MRRNATFANRALARLHYIPEDCRDDKRRVARAEAVHGIAAFGITAAIQLTSIWASSVFNAPAKKGEL
jgi:hypothetical protein